MYFTLEVNETLANAMRAAAELRAEIGKVIKEEEAPKTKRLVVEDLIEVHDDIGSIISRIGGFAGSLLADKVFDESNKIINNDKE